MDKQTRVPKMAWGLFATLALSVVVILLTTNLAWGSPLASQDPRIDPPDGPGDSAQSDPVAPPIRGVAAPTGGGEDPYTHWRVEFNTTCRFTDHSLYVPVGADPADMDDIILTMTNWDVDYVDQYGDCEAGAEVDRVYPNSGRFLGTLRGANDQWSTNSWSLQQSDVVHGDNLIYIDTDATGTGCWCVGVGWVEIKAKVGFHVKSVTPPDGQQGVPFGQNEVVIEITFNMDYDPETITPDTVSLYYKNGGGGKVKVPYTKIDSGSDVLRIKPDADLMDGVKYEIKVTTGVKNTGGQALEKEWTSNFWTLLDLEGKTADSKDKIETIPIQVSRGARFIPDKPAVYRVFIRWDEKADVHRDWQLEKAEFDVELKVGAQSLQQQAEIKRPDQYATDERRRAASSVNFYYTPSAAGGDLEAKVTQTPQQATPPKSFTANDNVQFVARSPRIKYDFWNIRANAWSATGVPPLAKSWGRYTILQGGQFTTETFPVIRTEVTLKGDTAPFPFTYVGTGDAADKCDGCRYGTCPPYTVPGGNPRWEWECTARRLWGLYGAAARANESPWVSGMALQALVPDAAAWQWDVPGGGKVFVIQYGTEASASTVAHETVHAGGIKDHIDSSQNVLGFRVRNGANKSFDDDGHTAGSGYNPEGNKTLANLMHTFAQPTASQWIDDSHYRILIDHFQNLAARSAEFRSATTDGYLLLSGDIIDDSTVLMGPALVVDFATFGVPTYTVPMPYSIVQYGGATLLNTTYFSPTYMGDGLHVTYPDSVSFGVNPPPGSARYLSFVTAVPFDEAADRVEIQHNSVAIKTINRTAHAPEVVFTTPEDGAILTGTANIAWTVKDLDGDTLYTMLLWSEDGGESYAPLTELVSGEGQYEMDTTRAHSTQQGRLKLMVTDGFNTSEAVISVIFDNTPGFEAYDPTPSYTIPPGSTGVPRLQPVSVWFNSSMEASQFISDELSLHCDSFWQHWISGTLSYDSATRRLTLTPFRPLPYDSLCEAYVEAGLVNELGQQLPQEGWTYIEDKYFPYATSWAFRTAVDLDHPTITEVFPLPDEQNVPVNALVSVLIDDSVDASTITGDTLYLTDAAGTLVPGIWSLSYDRSYEGRPDGANFRPSNPLLPGTTYTATVTTGITDWMGNALEGGKVWSFTTGNWASSGLRILGEYDDWVEDENNDGKYDWLMIDVAIESALDAPPAGECDLNAQLLDRQGVEVGWAASNPAYCDLGIYRRVLAFPGAKIRSHGVDGSYMLDEVHLYYTEVPTLYDNALRAYTTRAYSASDFAAVLTFGGLPDLVLPAGTVTPVPVDLTQYAWHASLPVTELDYTLVAVTDPEVSASMSAPGLLQITAPVQWAGDAEVFVRASDGAHTALDSFLVTRDTVQPSHSLYLPVVLHGAAGHAAPGSP